MTDKTVPDITGTVEELEDRLALLLLDQNTDRRDIARLRKLMAAREKVIEALSQHIEELREPELRETSGAVR